MDNLCTVSILGALHDAEVSHRSPATNRREYSHWVVKPYESKTMIGMLSPYWCFMRTLPLSVLFIQTEISGLAETNENLRNINNLQES